MYYEKNIFEKQHILIHDIKNHLNTISQLNDGKHIDEITRYINNILGSDAPMYESSLNSLYVITLIGFALFTILGSAARKPDTSVQFS